MSGIKLFLTLFITIVLLTFGSCRKRPEGILSDKEMENLLCDMLLADAYEQSSAGRNLPDSVRRQLGKSILAAHGISQETLDSTYNWYGANLDDYYKLYEKVEKRLSKRKRNLDGSTTGTEEHHDDIWPLPRHIRFSSLGYGDVLVFELPSEAISKGERMEWGLWNANGSEISLLLGIDYSDGSTAIIEREFRGERKPILNLISDTTKNVTRIFGSIAVNSSLLPLTIDSISLIRLPYDSIAYRNNWSQKLYHAPLSKPIPSREEPDKTDSITSDSIIKATGL